MAQNGRSPSRTTAAAFAAGVALGGGGSATLVGDSEEKVALESQIADLREQQQQERWEARELAREIQRLEEER